MDWLQGLTVLANHSMIAFSLGADEFDFLVVLFAGISRVHISIGLKCLYAKLFSMAVASSV